jgi:pimeloyl-ACP methyl ester carboxylesterase
LIDLKEVSYDMMRSFRTLCRKKAVITKEIQLPGLGLGATLRSPSSPKGLILFAHGSGSSRFSPRNTFVAETLNQAGFGTLLLDLLTPGEEADRRNVFDISLLADRLVFAVEWIDRQPELSYLRLGFFGASTGAAAALVAAARLGDRIAAVVSRGGRPDLAGQALGEVRAPTLLIVGGSDYTVLELNESALAQVRARKSLRIVPDATHLFEEPGALEKVSEYAQEWFMLFLAAQPDNALAGHRH